MSKIDKDMEELISWLKSYYKANDKEKFLIELKICNTNPDMFKWLGTIKKYNKEQQEELYKQLRGKFV